MTPLLAPPLEDTTPLLAPPEEAMSEEPTQSEVHEDRVQAPAVQTVAATRVKRGAERRAAARRRRVRLVSRLAEWTLFGLIAGLVLSFSVPNIVGMHSFVVMSGSMTPTLKVGDVVVDRPVGVTDVRIGDIITFKDPAGNRLVTHRVRRLGTENGKVDIETKGDRNNSVEDWSVGTDGRVGLVVYHVPKVGYALTWTRTRQGRLFLVLLVLVIGVYEIVELWRPKPNVAQEPGEAS